MMRVVRLAFAAILASSPAMAQHLTGYMAGRGMPLAPVFAPPVVVVPQVPVQAWVPPVPVYEAPVSHVTNCTTVWVAPFQMMSCY